MLLLIQNTAVWGEGRLLSPKTNSDDSAWPWQVLKGIREIIAGNHWDGGQSRLQAPLHADLCSFFRCCLVHSLSVCWWDYEEEIREEIWSSLSSVQFLSHVRLFANPWTAARQASLSITNSQSLLKLMSIQSVMPSKHLILWCPLLLSPSIFPSIRVFSDESVLHSRWPKYWSFSFSISPSNEYSGLISFRMDWLDLLAVQGTLRSLLQHHSSKASILQRSAFFIVQLSHPYMTTGKTIPLTRWTFVSKVMSLLFNMLCRLVIAFLPRSKRLLISWL